MEPHAWPDDITKWPVSKPVAQSLYRQLERGICISLCGATAVVLKVGWCSLLLVVTNTTPGQPWPWLCPAKSQSPPRTEILLNQLKPWALRGNRVMVTGSASERRCCLRLRQAGLKHHPAVRGGGPGRPLPVALASSQGAALTLRGQHTKSGVADCSLLSFSRSAQKTVLGITPTTFTWTA